ncbi:hypothetical protein [Noviherbaspirillum autotrophicum]|nr:hypothetical protein [Noviherbaspirillum autotrophicum]
MALGSPAIITGGTVPGVFGRNHNDRAPAPLASTMQRGGIHA